MNHIPADWDTLRTPRLPGLRHLVHSACGWISYLPHDLETDQEAVQRITSGHNCQEARKVTFR